MSRSHLPRRRPGFLHCEIGQHGRLSGAVRTHCLHSSSDRRQQRTHEHRVTRPPRGGLDQVSNPPDAYYAALDFCTAVAAARITSITKPGWESMGTWLLSTS